VKWWDMAKSKVESGKFHFLIATGMNSMRKFMDSRFGRLI